MLQKYKKYLEKLNNQLAEYFEDQREFIACQAGCGICCKSSYYAISNIEYNYVREGFQQLNQKKQDLIRQKAVKIFKDKREFLKTNPDVFAFSYECPFLENNSCSIYEYRPLLCRSHGLIYRDIEKSNKLNMPYCVNLGLNYANIWDKDLRRFSEDKMRIKKIKAKPQAYDLSYSSLMKNAQDIDFGDVRMIIEWIILDIPNYEEIIK